MCKNVDMRLTIFNLNLVKVIEGNLLKKNGNTSSKVVN